MPHQNPLRNRAPKTSIRRLDPSVERGLQQAQQLEENGDFAAAQSAYRRLLKADKRCLPALVCLARLKRHAGDFADAEQFLSRAAKIAKHDDSIRLELAHLHFVQNDNARAAEICDRLLARRPTIEALSLRAELHERVGEQVHAKELYLASLALHDDIPQVHNNIGLIYRQEKQFSLALQHFDRAVALNPRGIAARSNRANTYKILGEFDRAISEYVAALDCDPTNADALFNLGLCHQQNGAMSAALDCFEKIIKLYPDHEQARIQICECLINLGKLSDAQRAVDGLLNDYPRSANAWYLQAELHAFDATRKNTITSMLELLHNGDCDDDAKIFLHFGLGKLFDAGGDYAAAFTHYSRGNELRRSEGRSEDRIAGDLRAKSDEALLDSRAQHWQPIAPPAVSAVPKMIFIFGMPRSGTTLVEQVLAAHSQVTPAGEVDFFAAALARLAHRRDGDDPHQVDPRSLSHDECQHLHKEYLARLESIAPKARVVTDKTPGNYDYLGILQRIFPDAVFIHCRRHPLATGLSIYCQLFNSLDYAYAFDDMAGEYSRYLELMSHWRRVLSIEPLEVRYESLVSAPDVSIATLLTHCGLAWEDQCLHPERANRAIHTMSRIQARQTINTRSVEHWRAYTQALTPLAAQLEAAVAAYVADD